VVDLILGAVDPRLSPQLKQEYAQRLAAADALPPIASTQKVVLVGHRAAGKTTLLPLVARLLGRPAVDLDNEIERRHEKRIQVWYAENAAAFRKAERDVFQALDSNLVISAGGGFLALHADLLQGHVPILVPVSFETYRQRLTGNKKRPRLRPEVPIHVELAEVYKEREAAHAKVPTYSLVDLLLMSTKHGEAA
jgi:shikimate kinase